MLYTMVTPPLHNIYVFYKTAVLQQLNRTTLYHLYVTERFYTTE